MITAVRTVFKNGRVAWLMLTSLTMSCKYEKKILLIPAVKCTPRGRNPALNFISPERKVRRPTRSEASPPSPTPHSLREPFDLIMRTAGAPATCGVLGRAHGESQALRRFTS
jgi:hypothetical protein